MNTLEIERPTRQAARKPEHRPAPDREHGPATTVSLSLQALGVPARPVFLPPEPAGTAGQEGGRETLWDRLRLSWQDPWTRRDRLPPAPDPQGAGW